MSQSNPPFWSCACMQGGAILLVYPKYVFTLPTQLHTQECPICTVSYPSMNTASCCSARVCTECFVYHQTASDPPGKAQCPFCKYTPFAVRVSAGACSRAVLSWLGECLLGCAVVCWAPHLKQCRTPLLRAWECAHRCCRIFRMQGYAAVWVGGWVGGWVGAACRRHDICPCRIRPHVQHSCRVLISGTGSWHVLSTTLYPCVSLTLDIFTPSHTVRVLRAVLACMCAVVCPAVPWQHTVSLHSC